MYVCLPERLQKEPELPELEVLGSVGVVGLGVGLGKVEGLKQQVQLRSVFKTYVLDPT